MVKVNERQFLRHFAGTSLMPALLVWGMHKGEFSEDGAPLGLRDIADATGYTVPEVYHMCQLIDSLYVEVTDNETPDSARYGRG